MIDFRDIAPGMLIEFKDSSGVKRHGAVTHKHEGSAGIEAFIFAEFDDKVQVPLRAYYRTDIDGPILACVAGDEPSEAEAFFKGATLEEAVLTILGTKSMSDFIDPPDPESLDALVGNVANELRDGPLSRVEDVTEKATDAFFQVVAAEFPEIKTGDLDPLTVDQFRRYSEKTVEQWVELNRP